MYNFVINKELYPEKVLNEIKRLENKYNIEFPDVLKTLYTQSEGGKIKLCVFTINNYTYEVSTIIPILHVGLYFEKIVEFDRMDGFIPSTFYPIAMDRGGNTFYWDCITKNVYLSLTDDIENPVYIIADVHSFLELLNCSIRQ